MDVIIPLAHFVVLGYYAYLWGRFIEGMSRDIPIHMEAAIEAHNAKYGSPEAAIKKHLQRYYGKKAVVTNS